MPLTVGKSEKTFGKNVSELMKHGHEQKQAVAIAYEQKREAMNAALPTIPVPVAGLPKTSSIPTGRIK